MNKLDNMTAHEYAQTVRDYLRLLSDDKDKIEEIAGVLINRSYDHFKGFFERNTDRLTVWPSGKDNPKCICTDIPNVNCDVHVRKVAP